ncbi:MAG: hypothetical protein MSA31_09290 [Bacteroidales bacterium]|nr:hypothetical protein [Bacteroidales bacterium]
MENPTTYPTLINTPVHTHTIAAIPSFRPLIHNHLHPSPTRQKRKYPHNPHPIIIII